MKNLVLLGFMGSGKTTVGRLAAAELEMRFVDMERLIEEKEGSTISEIFEKRGETAFREIEAGIALELSEQIGLVIATGGGVALRSSNLEILGRTGVLVHLQVDAKTVLDRTRHSTHRPLLQTDDPAKKIAGLLAQRQLLYDAIPNQISTVGRRLREVCSDVIHIYRSFTKQE